MGIRLEEKSPSENPKVMISLSRTYASTDISFVQAYGHGGEACLPSNAYYLWTPDYTLYSGVHVCWSEHSDSSFVYGFMSLDYGLGTMTATT